MTAAEDVLFSLEDGVATITLNRPERRNAMSDAMIAGLGEMLQRAEDDDAVRVVLLTGAGGAFCSGGDVQGFAELGEQRGAGTTIDPAAVEEQIRHQELTVGRMATLPVPVLAALPGAAAGAGLGLALAADLRIGCERTVMATAFAGVALSGDFGVAWWLDRIVGPAKARELMLLNPRLDAQACADLGLIHELVPSGELDDRARALARRLATGPSPALRHIKRNLVDVMSQTLTESMRAEVPRHHECSLSEHHVEAARAFVEKRPPSFEH